MKKLTLFLMLILVSSVFSQTSNKWKQSLNILSPRNPTWTLSIPLTTTSGYTSNILSEWTAGAAMASGGSNGIYAICNPVEDVQNAYALRGRMDLRDAAANVAVNQLHAIDALINLADTVDYFADDNISVIGGAIHGGSPSGAMDGTNTGALGGATLNILFGMWGPTAEQDYTLETNFIKMISHAETTVDYGLNIESSSDMDAGILLNNHISNSPATMDVGLEMISADGSMIYGIDMEKADFTTADLLLSNGAVIYNDSSSLLTITEANITLAGDVTITGNLITTGHHAIHGGMFFNNNSATQTPVAADTMGIINFTSGLLNGFTFDAGSAGSYTFVRELGTEIGLYISSTTLAIGDWIFINGSTVGAYEGSHEVVLVSNDTVYVTATYSATATGDYQEPSKLTLTATGHTNTEFIIAYNMSGFGGGSPSTDLWNFGAYVNGKAYVRTMISRTLTTAAVYGAWGSGGIITMSTNDDLFMFMMSDDTNEITLYQGSVRIEQL